MALTDSPKLGLTRNEGSDPFRRQDFNDNWDTLDLNPGVFICTSTTRPAWTAERAGRIIYETDTKLLRAKTPTGWTTAPIGGFPGIQRLSVTPSPNVLGRNVHRRYDLLPLITPARTCSIMIWASIRLVQQTGLKQSVSYPVFVDDTDADFGHSSSTQFGDSGTGAAGNFGAGFVMMGWRGGLTAGVAHKVQCDVTVGDLSTDGMTIPGIKAYVMYLDPVT